MLGSLLKAADMTRKLPAVLDALPPSTWLAQSRQLASGLLDSRRFAQALLARDRTLAGHNIPVVLRPHPGPHARHHDGMTADRRAHTVLTLFFHQLLMGDDVLLDLRHQAFTAHADTLLWSPHALVARLEPPFVGTVQRLYAGLLAPDAGMLDDAVEGLGLGAARALLEEGVGGTAPGHALFAVLALCVEARVELPPDVLPWALCVASLQQHLRTLGVSVDARSAFTAAGGSLPERRAGARWATAPATR